jgi:hypothetical protein
LYNAISEYQGQFADPICNLEEIQGGEGGGVPLDHPDIERMLSLQNPWMMPFETAYHGRIQDPEEIYPDMQP